MATVRKVPLHYTSFMPLVSSQVVPPARGEESTPVPPMRPEMLQKRLNRQRRKARNAGRKS